MRYRSKRGSLQLSINAIVILILAITLLGLGLGFIKNQFGSVTEQFGQVSQDIENEIIDRLRTSGEILAFDKTRIVAERGKPQDFFVGIKNTDGQNSRCYKLKFYCSQALTATNPACPPGVQVGGEGAEKNWFSTFQGQVVDPLDVAIAPVKLQIADAGVDTYNMRVELEQDLDAEAGCADFTAASGYTTLQSKQFFLEVR